MKQTRANFGSRRPRARLGGCFVLVALLALPAPAVELQLVPFDDLGKTVDKLVKERPIVNPISTPNGVEMKQIGIDYTGWARNVLLDGKPVFERYYEGKYITRSGPATTSSPSGRMARFRQRAPSSRSPATS